jgi:hypothetical protein
VQQCRRQAVAAQKDGEAKRRCIRNLVLLALLHVEHAQLETTKVTFKIS